MKKVVLTAAVLIAGVSFANAQTAKAEKISKAKAEVATKAAVKAEAKSDTAAATEDQVAAEKKRI